MKNCIVSKFKQLLKSYIYDNQDFYINIRIFALLKSYEIFQKFEN